LQLQRLRYTPSPLGLAQWCRFYTAEARKPRVASHHSSLHRSSSTERDRPHGLRGNSRSGEWRSAASASGFQTPVETTLGPCARQLFLASSRIRGNSGFGDGPALWRLRLVVRPCEVY
jgi:hypothetical protein